MESGSVGLFGTRLAVLRQPLRAAGRSTAATERLLALVQELPDGAALALVDVRSTRDATRTPPLLAKLAAAVKARGGEVVERTAPRRGELQAWIRRHAAEMEATIEPRAAAVLAERIGGAVAESDVERGEQTRIADSELRKLTTYAGDRPIAVEDVEALVADTRPASLFAITNAIDRRDPAAASVAVDRALAEGQPVLRILGALQGRLSDLIVARDLAARGATPPEITKRVGRGNARMAERLVEAARRYAGVRAGDDADRPVRGGPGDQDERHGDGAGAGRLAGRVRDRDAPGAASRVAALGRGRNGLGGAGAQDAVALDGEGAASFGQPQDADQLLIHVQLAAGHAQRTGDREEQALVGDGVLERGVEHAAQQMAAAEAAGLDRPCQRCVLGHEPQDGIGPPPSQ